MHGRYYRLLSVVLSLAAAAQLSAMAYGAPEAGRPEVATVNFNLYRGYLIVARGSAGPLKDLNFLLDTGASPTLLDPRLARKLHLGQRPIAIGVLGGRVRGAEAIVPSLGFGPIHRDNFPVVVEDLSFLEKALSVRIDAMIGLDVLGQSSFLIDYSSHTIRFGPHPPMQVSVPLRMQEGLPVVDAQVNHLPVRLLVDTGASSLIIFETKMPRQVLNMKVSAVQRSTNMIGDFKRNEVWLDSLRFGGAELGKEPAFLVRDRSDSEPDLDGLMSPAALGITKVAIDLEQGVLAFSR